LETAAQVRLGYMGEATESSLSGSTQESLDFEARFIADNLRRIFRQIYRIVRNVDDAQDLTQEAFIKALQRRDQLKDAEKAAHWLSRIASNTAIDFLRRHGRVNFSDIDDLTMPLTTAVEDSPECILLRSEQGRYLEGGLSVLTERERLAILLRDVDDLPAEEVARQLNCSKATVRSHIANARIKMRRYMERRKA
jgi:RNA polymerase sigma-70 factor (ECF subfamily)